MKKSVSTPQWQIEIPRTIANDYFPDWISRLKNTVPDAIEELLVKPIEIQRHNNESMQERREDIMYFSNHFTRYIKREWYSETYSDVDDEIISTIVLYFNWKAKNWNYLEHHSLVGSITSVEEKIWVIQKVLLWKLGISDDVIEWTDTWDRIAFEIEKIRAT